MTHIKKQLTGMANYREDVDTPLAILKILKENEGKQVNLRLAHKVEGEIGGEVRIRRQYGMCSLEWGGYWLHDPDHRSGSLLLAYGEKNVIVDKTFVQENNKRYFGAAVERNRLRANVTEELLDKAQEAIQALLGAKKTLAQLTAYGEPMGELIGMRKLYEDQ